MSANNAEAIYNNQSVCNVEALLKDSPGSMDRDKVLDSLMFSLYSLAGGEGYQLSNPPTALQIQTLSASVNRLMAYFTKNGIPTSNNPAALQVYNALTGTGNPGGESLAAECADVTGTDATKAAAALSYFENGGGAELIQYVLPGIANAFTKNPDAASNPDINNGDANIKGDVSALQAALSKYNTDMNTSGISARTINQDLSAIALQISNYNADCAATPGGEQDGGLLSLTDMLGAGGANSIETLAAAFAASPAVGGTAQLAFQAALTNAGEGLSGGSNSLSGMMNYTNWCEGW